jgi:hypothetical protein
MSDVPARPDAAAAGRRARARGRRLGAVLHPSAYSRYCTYGTYGRPQRSVPGGKFEAARRLAYGLHRPARRDRLESARDHPGAERVYPQRTGRVPGSVERTLARCTLPASSVETPPIIQCVAVLS